MKKTKVKQKVLVVVGPTASGKSALAVRLAKKFSGEVISADSRQVYRGLDIGTGKITKRQMQGIRHHLLDVVNPGQTFTASDFVRLGRQAVEGITKRGKLPIIAGGTGFYIDALLGTISVPEVPPNKKLRASLKKKSVPQLFAQLKQLDPRRAKIIERKNPVRLIRAIEIAKALGKVPPQNSTMIYRSKILGLRVSDAGLRKKIHTRLLARIRQGMITEAQRLRRNSLSLKRMRELGLEYRFLADYLEKKIAKEELLNRIERGNIEYAKRQMRWFKRNKKIHWHSPTELKRIEKKVKRFFKN